MQQWLVAFSLKQSTGLGSIKLLGASVNGLKVPLERETLDTLLIRESLLTG